MFSLPYENSCDLSGLKGQVSNTLIHGLPALVGLDGRKALPYLPHHRHVADAILRGAGAFTGTLAELAFAQFARFYFLGEGRLSRFIDYDYLLPHFNFSARPIEVSVVLTKLCNLRCLHCYNDSGMKDEFELSNSEKLRLVDFLGRWGIIRLTLTGGEATLDPVFDDVLRVAADYGLQVKLSTNGWALPPSLLDAIRAKTVEQVNISLDGADRETHDRFRQRSGSFDRVMRSLNILRKVPPKILVLNVSVHSEALPQMEAITKIAFDVNATAISFKTVLSTGRKGIQDTFSLSARQVREFQAERDRLRRLYGSAMEIDGKLISDAIDPDILESVSCNAGATAMVIDADGRMLPCESLGHVDQAPNFRDTTPIQAWLHDPVFNGFRAVRAHSSGGCGTAGCPGAQMKRLVQLQRSYA